jgi:hypothetical protein
MLISTALLLDSIIRNSVCTPAKLPCRRVEVGYENYFYNYSAFLTIIINHVTVTFDLSTNIVSTNKKLKHPCRYYDIVPSFKFILKVGFGESIENAPLV